MAVDVTVLIQNLVSDILGDREAAAQYASDPAGTIAAQGITEEDLSSVDVPEIVQQTCASGGYPNPYDKAPAEGHPTPPSYHDGPQTAEDIQQHLNYVTYVQYEGDDYITQTIAQDFSTTIDNSVDNSVNLDHSTLDDTIIGDNNQAVQNDGPTEGSSFNFGEGDVSTINDSKLDDTAVATGGNATNHSEETDVEAYDSTVGTEQGFGDNEVHEYDEHDKGYEEHDKGYEEHSDKGGYEDHGDKGGYEEKADAGVQHHF